MQPDSWAIYVAEGSTLKVIDSCFVDNNFVGKGAVIVESTTADQFSETGNSGTLDEGLACPFASFGGTCVPFSSKKCGDSGTTSITVGLTWTVAALTAAWYSVCFFRDMLKT